MRYNKKRFIYLISPPKIESNFFKDLNEVLKQKKTSFFQLRLKKNSFKKKLIIGRKIQKICKKFKVKFIINDNPLIAKKVGADGCHLGQNDMDIEDAKKLLKRKIIGITCNNSVIKAKLAIKNKADYIAIGAFNSSTTKKIKYKASINDLRKIRKFSKKPIVAIGGINQNNYKKLLLNKADFLAISSFVWKNKKLKPVEAIKTIK